MPKVGRDHCGVRRCVQQDHGESGDGERQLSGVSHLLCFQRLAQTLHLLAHVAFPKANGSDLVFDFHSTSPASEVSDFVLGSYHSFQ